MTFVPQDQFTVLTKNRHSVLLGPRGSGKTTLLKMLQPQALEYWEGDEGEQTRAAIDYTGVFVSTDVSWGAQREALGDGKLHPDVHEQLGRALFVTHVLRALVAAMEYRTSKPTGKEIAHFRRLSVPMPRQWAIVKALADRWQLSPKIATYTALKQSLVFRMADIRKFAQSLVGQANANERVRADENAFLRYHFLDEVICAITLFNDDVDEPEAPWALCFDELEIAPDWVSDQLFRSIRSADYRILIKMAMSPVSTRAYPAIFEHVTGPSTLNDFDTIRLWYTDKLEPLKFCHDLWNAVVKRKGHASLTPHDVLDYSQTELDTTNRKSTKSAYGVSSDMMGSFERLSRSDVSFAAYLKKEEITLDKLEELSPEKFAATIRKVAPIVVFRDYFRASDDQKRALRTRKISSVYSGADSVFAVTEGNPRWFLLIVNAMLDKAEESDWKISKEDQAEILTNVAGRFLAMLKTLPVPPAAVGSLKLSLIEVIDRVGLHFERKILIDDFNPDPEGTFSPSLMVTPRELAALLDKAVNAGALIYLPGQRDELILRSVAGKRFRLSYLLLPLFRVPIRKGRSVSLIRILKLQENSPRRQIPLIAESDL